MAINTTNIGAGNVTVYTSSGESALTFMSFCNHGTGVVQVNIHLVPDGDAPTVNNLLASNLAIDPGDTYIFYQGGEKILLENNDYVSVSADSANDVAVITSYIGLS